MSIRAPFLWEGTVLLSCVTTSRASSCCVFRKGARTILIAHFPCCMTFLSTLGQKAFRKQLVTTKGI